MPWHTLLWYHSIVTDMMTPKNWIGSIVLVLFVILLGIGLASWKYGSLQTEQAASANQPEPSETVTVVAPDGTVDSKKNRFWNAVDTCCDFDGKKPELHDEGEGLAAMLTAPDRTATKSAPPVSVGGDVEIFAVSLRLSAPSSDEPSGSGDDGFRVSTMARG